MAGTLCGQADPPLNSEGSKQASALAALLSGWNVRRIYSSDLQRALQTAVPLAESWKIPVKARTDLREISFGAWEGKKWSEIDTDARRMWSFESSPDLSAPGGETFASFRDRVLRAFSAITSDANGDVAAVIAHLGVIRTILSELRVEGPLWNPQQRIGYCAVYRLRIGAHSTELTEIRK